MMAAGPRSDSMRRDRDLHALVLRSQQMPSASASLPDILGYVLTLVPLGLGRRFSTAHLRL